MGLTPAGRAGATGLVGTLLGLGALVVAGLLVVGLVVGDFGVADAGGWVRLTGVGRAGATVRAAGRAGALVAGRLRAGVWFEGVGDDVGLAFL